MLYEPAFPDPAMRTASATAVTFHMRVGRRVEASSAIVRSSSI
jgi:hypothetical protein